MWASFGLETIMGSIEPVHRGVDGGKRMAEQTGAPAWVWEEELQRKRGNQHRVWKRLSSSRRVWSVALLQRDPGSFFWIQQQGDFWGPLTSYLGGEVGPEARLNVVGWGVKCKHFLPPNSKPRWFIGESFRKSNLQKIPVLQKLL